MSEQDQKSFVFANAKKSANKTEVKAIGQFDINGQVFRVRALKDTAVAYLIHRARNAKSDVVISAVLDFLEKALVPADYPAFEELALDPEDGLELEQVVEVFEHVLSMVAAGDPTGGSSASSPRSSRTGAGSRTTARRAESSTR